MSQHIVPLDSTTEAVVGWDPPMETFFAQIYKIDETGERISAEDNGTILWIGTRSREIYELETLIGLLATYKLRLDRKLQADLYADRDDGR